MYQKLQKFDIHWHGGGPSMAMVFHLRRVSELLYNWKSYLLSYMKDFVLHIFFNWNEIVRVRVYYPLVCKEYFALVKFECRYQFQLLWKWCWPNTPNACCVYTEKFVTKVACWEMLPFWDALISPWAVLPLCEVRGHNLQNYVSVFYMLDLTIIHIFRQGNLRRKFPKAYFF